MTAGSNERHSAHGRAMAPALSGAVSRQDFWTAYQPGLRASDAPVGSPAFFAEVESRRYGLEPHIAEVVGFERWAGADVLEAGCGIATDGIRFVRANACYTGLDFSPMALSLARRRLEFEGRAARFVQGSVVHLPFADASFDLVYSNGVIHHVPETGSAISEFHRVLRPGGTAIVMVYHRRSFNFYVSIMTVRRLLASLLLVPHADRAIARLIGEAPEVLEGHRRLLQAHGPRYLTDPALFLSHNTDGPGNPLSKTYTADAIRSAFSDFAVVDTQVRFLNLRAYPAGERLERLSWARKLGRRYGWHLWIRATKRP
jgi:ubiquinone/menaquinone biosynthesis C-methylase UbiE